VYLPEADELLFMCLKPKIVLEKDKDELVKGLTNLKKTTYLTNFLIIWCCWNLYSVQNRLKSNQIRKLSEFLLMKNFELSSRLSEAITVRRLYLTLPVTVASALKCFKTLVCLRSSLAVFSTEIQD